MSEIHKEEASAEKVVHVIPLGIITLHNVRPSVRIHSTIELPLLPSSIVAGCNLQTKTLKL